MSMNNSCLQKCKSISTIREYFCNQNLSEDGHFLYYCWPTHTRFDLFWEKITPLLANKSWLKIENINRTIAKTFNLSSDRFSLLGVKQCPLFLVLWWSAPAAEVKYSKRCRKFQNRGNSFFNEYRSKTFFSFLIMAALIICNVHHAKWSNYQSREILSLRQCFQYLRSTFDGCHFFPALPKWRCFSSESIFRQMLRHSLI